VKTDIEHVAGQLAITPNIKAGIIQIANNTSNCINDYLRVLAIEGRRFLEQTGVLMNALSLDDIKFEEISGAISSLDAKIKEVRRGVENLQSDVSTNVEDSRNEKLNHERECSTKRDKMGELEKKITRLESDIRRCEEDQRTLANAAAGLEGQAKQLDEKQKKHDALGGLSLCVTLVAAVFVPFTGNII